MNVDRDRSIISQVAAKAATDIAVATIAAGGVFDADAWLANHELFNSAIVDGSSAPDAVATITQAFPQAQVVNEQPFPQPTPVAQPTGGGYLAQCGINPNGLSTARDDKSIEFQLVQDLDASGTNGWYDNRTNKRNPKGPDFKRKSDGKALWLKGA